MPTRPNGLWRKASFSLFSQIFFTLSTHMLATMSIRKKEAGMKTWQWVSIIVVALVVCVIGAVIGPFFAFGRGWGGYGMMNGSLLSRPARTARPVQADWRNCPHCGTALGG
jgi:hypothetical protein